ncbi:hypothetical protein MGSAQ_000332 [marine sediment metagenome]|uniref:Uncharacterized protein n=1 Tax=marine sediment metagenome TaxID=412755 RepID=A0A1B6NYP1_9ZZZZ
MHSDQGKSLMSTSSSDLESGYKACCPNHNALLCSFLAWSFVFRRARC